MSHHLRMAAIKASLVLVVLLVTAAALPAQVSVVNTQTNQITGSSMAIPRPTGLQAGDLMIVNINIRGVDADPTTPGGWVKRAGYNLGTANRWGYVAYKVATATDVSTASYTFSNVDADFIAGAITAFRNVNTGVNGGVAVTGGSYSADNANPITPPSITTLNANDAVIFLAQLQDASGSITNNSWRLGGASGTLMAQMYILNPTAANLAGVGGAFYTQATAGASGAGYATATDGRRGGSCYHLEQ